MQGLPPPVSLREGDLALSKAANFGDPAYCPFLPEFMSSRFKIAKKPSNFPHLRNHKISLHPTGHERGIDPAIERG